MSTAYRRFAWADTTTGGTAIISGVVRALTTPVGGRPVYLMTQEGLVVRRATRSESNGTYLFSGLATGMTWLVLSVDPTGTYNAVVADRVTT